MNLKSFAALKLFSLVFNEMLAKESSPSTYSIDDNFDEKPANFREIQVGYSSGGGVGSNTNNDFGAHDISGINDWSYISAPNAKRCEFREINVMCLDDIGAASPVCQLNCNHRGYMAGLCYSEPGPGTQPSGEWQQTRGATHCYCGNCQIDKCMHYCYNFGFATGYCHQSASFGTGCKCVGCETSLCGKHCNSVYGNALQQSLCKNNQCKCVAKSCDTY